MTFARLGTIPFLLALCAVLPAPAHASAAISGTVRIAASGEPLENGTIFLLDSDTQYVSSATSTVDGTYAFDGLDPGQYAVCIIDSSDSYLDVCYEGKNVAADGTLTFTPIALTSDQHVDDIDFVLQAGAEVSGVLRDSYFNKPIVNATTLLTFYSPSQTLLFTQSVVTSADGQFTIGGIAAGSYYIQAQIPAQPYTPNTFYTTRLLRGDECTPACSFTPTALISVAASGLPDLNADFFPGHVVTGRVFDAASNAGIANVVVNVSEFACFIDCVTGSTISDAEGNYILAHVVGTHTFIGTGRAAKYINQVWPDTACPDAPASECLFGSYGSPLVFSTPDQVLSGIDFALALGSSVSGRVTLSGNPAAGAANANVVIYRNDDQSVPQVVQTLMTDATGQFVSDGWSSGTFFVAAWKEDFDTSCQVYSNQPCGPGGGPYPAVSNATPIMINDAKTTPGIDLQISIEDIFFDDFDGDQ